MCDFCNTHFEQQCQDCYKFACDDCFDTEFKVCECCLEIICISCYKEYHGENCEFFDEELEKEKFE